MTSSEFVKKLVGYDWREGIAKRAAGYLLIVPFILVYAAQYSRTMEVLYEISTVTLGDFELYLWEGMIFPVEGMALSFPFRYLLLLLLPIWNVAAYPCRDWRERGSLLFPRIRDVGCWWVCKCLWLIESVVCYLLVLLGAVGLSAAVCGMEFTLESGEASEVSYGIAQSIPAGETFLYTVILPFVMLLGICALQMAVSLVWNLTVGFMTQIAILFGTLFWRSVFSVGSYFMTLRTCLNPEGLAAWPGILLGVLCYAGSLFAGIWVLRRKDIF